MVFRTGFLFYLLHTLSGKALGTSLCGIYHQKSAIVGDQLYFCCGNYTFDDNQRLHSTSSLYSLPLDATMDVSGPIPLSQFIQSPLPSAELSLANGIFFYDHTTLYAYGAMEDGDSYRGTDSVWKYNTTNQTWILATIQGGLLNFKSDPAQGVWASDPAHSVSFFTGGWTVGFHNISSGLVRLDTSDPQSAKWTFQSVFDSMQGPNIYLGVMVYVRKGQAGLLVALGGYDTTQRRTHWLWDLRPMTDIFVYDIFNNIWYLVEATGAIPSMRSDICAGVSSAPDDSSFQITMYGGWDSHANTPFSDVYVLTIPSFQWIQVDVENDPDNGVGRHAHWCHVYKDAQMIVGGGLVGGTDNPNITCDSHQPPFKVLDTSQYIWRKQFEPDLTYSVPDVVSAVVGGNSSGFATLNTPLGGWNDSALVEVFSHTVPRDTYNASSSAVSTPQSTQTSSSDRSSGQSNIGAIAGGVIGGVVGLVLIGLVARWAIRRQRTGSSPIEVNAHSGIWTGFNTELNDNEVYESGGNGLTAELLTRGNTTELDGQARLTELGTTPGRHE